MQESAVTEWSTGQVYHKHHIFRGRPLKTSRKPSYIPTLSAPNTHPAAAGATGEVPIPQPKSLKGKKIKLGVGRRRNRRKSRGEGRGRGGGPAGRGGSREGDKDEKWEEVGRLEEQLPSRGGHPLSHPTPRLSLEHGFSSPEFRSLPASAAADPG